MTIDTNTGQRIDHLLESLDEEGWSYDQLEWIDLESGCRCLQLRLRRGVESEELNVVLEEIPD